MAASIPPELIDSMMVKCGRCCCICRKFKPTQLQVHHIVEQANGGTDEEGNLIVTCMSCHTDIHTHVPFARRFSVAEQKGHRDATVQLVEKGILPGGTASMHSVHAFVVRVAETDLKEFKLSDEAVRVLIAAANAKGELEGQVFVEEQALEGYSIMAGTTNIGPVHGREEQKLRDAIECLAGAGFICGQGLLRQVTTEGFVFADEVLARAQIEHYANS